MKKLIAIILAVLTVVACMAGCGAQNTPATEAPKADASVDTPAAPAAPAEAVKVVLWHTLTDHHQAALNKIIEGFNASQTEYVVVAEQQPYSEFDAKLLQSTSAGNGPDFCTMFPSDAINYISDGYLYPFTAFVNDPEIGMPDFKEQVASGLYAEITQWGGEEIYMIPATFGSEILYYNKTMFDALNLEVPKTWSDVETCAKAIYAEYGIAGFGTDSITDSFQGWVKQAGSDYIDVENKAIAIDRDIAIEKLNWFANGVKEGYFRLVGEDYYFSNPFGSQAVGMYIGSAAGVDYAKGAIPAEGTEGHFEMGCAALPQEGPVNYVSSWGTTYICLSRDEQHARGVYSFLKYMTSEDVNVDWAIAFGATPAYKDGLENEKYLQYAETNVAAKALIEEYNYINYLPSIKGAATVRTEIDKMVQSVALGLMDAETAFDAFVMAANAALNDY